MRLQDLASRLLGWHPWMVAVVLIGLSGCTSPSASTESARSASAPEQVGVVPPPPAIDQPAAPGEPLTDGSAAGTSASEGTPSDPQEEPAIAAVPLEAEDGRASKDANTLSDPVEGPPPTGDGDVAAISAGAVSAEPAQAGAEQETPPARANDVPAAKGKSTAKSKSPGAASGKKAQDNHAHPFPRRVPIPEFSKNLQWLNSRPLTKQDLKGKFVLFDFWTYCCINCMHVLPELKKLERSFPNHLVVIGVHSAKFETEKETESIRSAILRYEIEHPVINDADHSMWNTYGVTSWPTIVLIDPEGNFVGSSPGEFKAEAVAAILNAALPYYRENGLLDETPLNFELEAHRVQPTPLRYPGKILADEAGRRLFISDSNHNRIVIATLEGKLLDVIGSGQIGREDGDYATASFNHPQGCALSGNVLYVADTENHLLRKVDLAARRVTTIAGTGEQAANPWPGWDGGPVEKKARRWVGPPRSTALNSPWALWVHKLDLFIAMAGCHQIWKMPLNEKEIGPYAGNAREDIVDGPLLPATPFGRGSSSFAQPSGLSSDGTWLFVADSEGSSIRAVPLAPGKEVRTVVGTDHLPFGQRLFAFGDVDGPKLQARFQHCLEVVYVNGQIYVADTYNHKIKVVDARTGDTKTLAGTGQPGTSDDPPQFYEPAGLAYADGKLYVADTNNHLIRTIDLASGKVATLVIEGLMPPASALPARR